MRSRISWEATNLQPTCGHSQDFSSCRKGGDRPKTVRFLRAGNALVSLAGGCPGNHIHAPHQVWAGSREFFSGAVAKSEHPFELCCTIAALLKAHLPSKFSLEPPDDKPLGPKQIKKSQALLPEFHRIVWTDKLPSVPRKVLSLDVDGGTQRETEQGGSKFGIFHPPSQFLWRAEKCRHPFHLESNIPDGVKSNVFRLLMCGRSHIAKSRIEFAKRFVKLKGELAGEEARLHASLPSHVQTVVRGKNILLAKHLLKEPRFPDVCEIDLMTGVDLVGTAEKSPLFDFKIVPAVATPECLLSSAEWRWHLVEARDVHEEDPHMARALWETTLKEVELGFLQGPFHELRQVQESVSSEKVIGRSLV